MKISVVIVSYKNYAVLEKCLNSIKTYNDIGNELEVIVVDNSPLKEKQVANIDNIKKLVNTYIDSDNRGFGAGNNLGCKYATGDILAFINPDIILIEPIFKHVMKLFNKENDVGIIGLKLLNKNMESNYSFFFDFNTKLYRKKTIKLWNDLNIFDDSCMYTSGANIFIKKDVFNNAGGFDENIFMYYEEPDLKRRILKNNVNAKFIFDPTVKMIHLDGSSTPNSIFSLKKEIQSTIYYGKKYGLDYIKKLNFEYRYCVMKRNIYTLLHLNEKKKEIDNLISCYVQELDVLKR